MWFLSLQKMFSPFFYPLSSFSICVMPNASLGTMPWWLMEETDDRLILTCLDIQFHYLLMKSLTESLCLYLHFLNPSIWRAREIKHPSKPVLSLAFCCLALSWTTPCDSGEKVFQRHRASLRSNAAVISHAEYSSIAVLLWCLDKSIWFASA